ncbi:MAG: hypothetical protein ABEK84_01615 [Salinibacter sp.]
MTRAVRSMVRASALLLLLVGAAVLASCDLASAGSTVILNADAPIPPIVQHRFKYTEDQLSVVSVIESEDLGEILRQNGFSRSDVVSARVDSVRVTPVSTASLSAAKIYLGTDDSGPLIANVRVPSDTPVVDRTTTPVTGAVKAGASKTFAQFRVDDPSSIPSGGSVVRATVYFRVELEGV